MQNGLFLTIDSLRKLSMSAQQELLDSIGVLEQRGEQTVAVNNILSNDDGPIELTAAMVRKLTEGLSGNTITALKTIASSETPKFHLKDVIEAIDGAKDYMDLRGVWSALTRRTRKIADDKEARLTWWDAEGIYDENKEYIDHIISVSDLTHKSLQSYFGSSN